MSPAVPSWSGRSSFARRRSATFDTELFGVLPGFAQNAGITLHITNHYGANNHHIAETCFKAVARALAHGASIDPRQADRVPSTKGKLGD
jgi:imidazoleglycerol-phosphate dehydratase